MRAEAGVPTPLADTYPSQEQGKAPNGTQCASGRASAVVGRLPDRRDVMKLLPGPDYFRDNIAFRNDTLLGVCEALGEDLRLPPTLLRVALASGIMFAPFLMVGIYFGLGLLVFASRTFFPPRAASDAPGRSSPAPVAENEDLDLKQAA
jgi:phage shock protein PspC (stress-responsive transcriptional regulator)